MHGYQIITELGTRSGGVWRPSPGSVYPTLQQLQDEGLVTVAEEDGRRTFSLTDAGKAEVERASAGRRAPWEAMADEADDAASGLKSLVGQLIAATIQVATAGTHDQVAQAEKVLTDARRAMYRLLAEDEQQRRPKDVTESAEGSVMSAALRIGDAEREAAISSLTSHFAEGRLTKVEHEERTELALNARTGRDLDVLFADLPRRGDETGATRRPSRGLRFEWLLAPVFAAIMIGAVIFVILNLLPIFAIIAIAILASRLLLGARFRRHRWHGASGWYGDPHASVVARGRTAGSGSVQCEDGDRPDPGGLLLVLAEPWVRLTCSA